MLSKPPAPGTTSSQPHVLPPSDDEKAWQRWELYHSWYLDAGCNVSKDVSREDVSGCVKKPIKDE